MTDKDDWKGLSFADLEMLLITSMQIDQERRATFVSRLKQWQKMNFPEMERVGKGSRAVYSLEHVFQLQTLIRLLELGLSPERGIGLIKRHWPGLRLGYVAAFGAITENPREKIFAFFYADALGEIIRTEHDRPSYMTVYEGELIGAALLPDLGKKIFEDFANRYEEEPAHLRFQLSAALTASALVELTEIVRRTIAFAEAFLPHVYDKLHLGFSRMIDSFDEWEADARALAPETIEQVGDQYEEYLEWDRTNREKTTHMATAITEKMEAVRGGKKA